MTFIIDGATYGSYTHLPDTTGDFIYNVPVFAQDGLVYTSHTITIATTSTYTSLVLFDYLMYTYVLTSHSFAKIELTLTILEREQTTLPLLLPRYQ